MPDPDRARYKTKVDEFFDRLPESDFRFVDCPLRCSTALRVDLFTKGTMIVSRCKCGMIWNRRQPTPAVLARFYRESAAMEDWARIKSCGGEFKRQEEKFSAAIDWISRQKRVGADLGTVIDVGAGTGVFLSLLKKSADERKQKVRLVATEPSDAARRMIPDYVEAFPWDMKDLLKKEPSLTGSASLVSLWGVLEHAIYPQQTIRDAECLVKKGGTLLICVPNVGSRIVEQTWAKCFTFCPQHLWYFDWQTLDRVVLDGWPSFHSFNSWGVEDERHAFARAIMGLDPYSDTPQWLADDQRYKNEVAQAVKYEPDFYKMVRLYKKGDH